MTIEAARPCFLDYRAGSELPTQSGKLCPSSPFLQHLANPVGTISRTPAFDVCLPRFEPSSIVAWCGTRPFGARGDLIMAWKTPKIVEVPVGMEINMYACAARK